MPSTTSTKVDSHVFVFALKHQGLEIVETAVDPLAAFLLHQRLVTLQRRQRDHERNLDGQSYFSLFHYMRLNIYILSPESNGQGSNVSSAATPLYVIKRRGGELGKGQTRRGFFFFLSPSLARRMYRGRLGVLPHFNNHVAPAGPVASPTSPSPRHTHT